MNDYERIAVRYLPRGYAVEYRKSLSGRHFGDRRLIQAPRPRTPKSLYIFLHECAHAYLRTGSGKRGKRHVQEMEANLWAEAKLTKHGIPIPPEYIERHKRYVAYKIVQAERRGGKHIDRRAIEYAGEHLVPMRDTYNRICGPSRHPTAA